MGRLRHPPRHPGSTGRVEVREGDSQYTSLYYPSVFGLKIVAPYTKAPRPTKKEVPSMSALQFPSFITAVTYVSNALCANNEDVFFGLEEITPATGHSVAHIVTIEAGSSWVIYRPNKVTYWLVCAADDYR